MSRLDLDAVFASQREGLIGGATRWNAYLHFVDEFDRAVALTRALVDQWQLEPVRDLGHALHRGHRNPVIAVRSETLGDCVLKTEGHARNLRDPVALSDMRRAGLPVPELHSFGHHAEHGAVHVLTADCGQAQLGPVHHGDLAIESTLHALATRVHHADVHLSSPATLGARLDGHLAEILPIMRRHALVVTPRQQAAIERVIRARSHVIHGDLAPINVVVDPDGRPTIVDAGGIVGPREWDHAQVIVQTLPVLATQLPGGADTIEAGIARAREFDPTLDAGLLAGSIGVVLLTELGWQRADHPSPWTFASLTPEARSNAECAYEYATTKFALVNHYLREGAHPRPYRFDHSLGAFR